MRYKFRTKDLRYVFFGVMILSVMIFFKEIGITDHSSDSKGFFGSLLFSRSSPSLSTSMSHSLSLSLTGSPSASIPDRLAFASRSPLPTVMPERCVVYYQAISDLRWAGTYENAWYLDHFLHDAKKACDFIIIPDNEKLGDENRVREFLEAVDKYQYRSLVILWTYRMRSRARQVQEYLRKCNDEYGLTSILAFHVSDEYRDTNEVVIYPYVDFIFKGYWFSPNTPYYPEFKDKIYCVPQGFKPNFGPVDLMDDFTPKRNKDKPYLGFYAGTQKKNEDYLPVMNWLNKTKLNHTDFKHKDVQARLTHNWAEDSFRSVAKYREAMADSIFVFCPYGNHPETYRMSETLEVGSIPLVKMNQHHFCEKWNELPVPKFGDWKDAPQMIEKILEGGINEVNRIQEDCWQWWLNWKQDMRSTLLTKVLTKHPRPNAAAPTSPPT